jgi:hypothetical protein
MKTLLCVSGGNKEKGRIRKRKREKKKMIERDSEEEVD